MCVRSRRSEAFLLYSDLAQTVKFRSGKKSCMGAPRRSAGFHLASRSMTVAEVYKLCPPISYSFKAIKNASRVHTRGGTSVG